MGIYRCYHLHNNNGGHLDGDGMNFNNLADLEQRILYTMKEVVELDQVSEEYADFLIFLLEIYLKEMEDSGTTYH